jgi:alpha-amylase
MGNFSLPAAGSYSYVYRFQVNGGSYTYCDQNGVTDGSATPGMGVMSTTGGASASTVSFIVDAGTYFGENIYVVGSDPALGAWKADAGVALNSGTTYPVWTGSALLTQGASVQFKLVGIDGSGTITWETSGNRSIAVPSAATATYLGVWDDPNGTITTP